jgi:raffinose/stachyose/melibiose transport system permease protein
MAILSQEPRLVPNQPDPAVPGTKPSRRGPRVLLWCGLILTGLIQLLPFWITVTTALKPASATSPQLLLPPGEITVENFVTAVRHGNIFTATLNSAIVTVLATGLTCILGALAAYPLARRASAANRLIYAAIMALIMVPPLSILVPLYSFLTDLGGANTYWGVIVVMVTGQLPMAVFLYTAFVRSIPISLEEAAALDGAGPIRTFFAIVLPLLKPVTATVIILTSVNIWNEYALSGYILGTPAVRTIAPAIASFFSQSANNLGAAAAASLIAVVPVLIAYLFLQQYFIRGMIAGAEK